MAFYTYIMASAPYGTLYIGHTDDLVKRVYQHREHVLKGFTADYKVTRLVWFDVHESRESAFTVERRMKKWNRRWKADLIEKDNPHWDDLYPSLISL